MNTAKYLLAFIFSLTFIKAKAQPDPVWFYPEKIERLSKQIEKDPGNYPLRWQRAVMLIDVQGRYIPLKDSSISFSTALQDLNLLIGNNAKFIDYDTISLKDFYYYRSLYYEQNNLIGNAITDIKQVIQLIPAYRLPDLQNSYIAACTYYTKNKDHSTAILYMDKADSLFHIIHRNDHDNVFLSVGYSENQRIVLLKTIGNKQKVVANYRNFIESYKNKYVEALRTKDKKEETYRISELRVKAFNYQYGLLQYYYDCGDFNVVNAELEKILPTLPQNKYGYPLAMYDNGKFYFLRGEIAYHKSKYKNAINDFLVSVGDPYQGGATSTAYFDTLIKQHPSEASLYLAKACIIIRNNYHTYDKTIAPHILQILKQAQELGSNDYRISYYKAIVYHSYLKDDEKALEYINTAIKNYPYCPFAYSTKVAIIENLRYKYPEKKFEEDVYKYEQKYLKER